MELWVVVFVGGIGIGNVVIGNRGRGEKEEEVALLLLLVGILCGDGVGG